MRIFPRRVSGEVVKPRPLPPVLSLSPVYTKPNGRIVWLNATLVKQARLRAGQPVVLEGDGSQLRLRLRVARHEKALCHYLRAAGRGSTGKRLRINTSALDTKRYPAKQYVPQVTRDAIEIRLREANR